MACYLLVYSDTKFNKYRERCWRFMCNSSEEDKWGVDLHIVLQQFFHIHYKSDSVSMSIQFFGIRL